jgi:UDP-N-acetylmuramoylalanine--D-glutamate ligase
METFAEKPVIVAGAGRSGLLAARLLAGEGARVTLRDDRSRADVEASLREPIPAGIAFLRGMPGEGEVRGSALLVVSPGVPRERLPLSALAAAGIPVWGELELGFRRFQG